MTLKLGTGLGPLKSARNILPFFGSNSSIITIGDSIMQANNFATSTALENQGDGVITWALRDLPAFRHHVWYDAGATGGATPPLFRGANFGLAGDTATQVAARTTPMINSGADLAIVLVGTNVGTTDALVSTTTASIQSILDDLTGAGIHVILGTILPRDVSTTPTGAQISPALMQRILDINTWIRGKGSNNVTIWDAWNDLVDPAYAQGVDDLYGIPLTGMIRDSVHLTPLGAYTAAQSLRHILQQMSGTHMYDDAWFNSDPAHSDNIITVGAFNGTSGYPQDGVTGTVASNWAVDNIDGGSGSVSAVCSLLSNTDTGGQTQRIVCTSDGLGSSSDNVETISLTPLGFVVNEATLSDGEWCQLFFKISVSASSVIGSLQCLLRNTTTGVIGRGMAHVDGNRANQPWPTEAFEGWLISEPVQYNSGNVFNPQLYMDILQTEAGNVTIDVEAAILLAVEDPHTTFPYIV
jgi:hypothetical protein